MPAYTRLYIDSVFIYEQISRSMKVSVVSTGAEIYDGISTKEGTDWNLLLTWTYSGENTFLGFSTSSSATFPDPGLAVGDSIIYSGAEGVINLYTIDVVESSITENTRILTLDGNILFNNSNILTIEESSGGTMSVVIVESLPITGEEGTMYLVPNGGTGQNIYDEYIYVNSNWEKIGTTDVDLTGYVTTSTAQDISGAKTFTQSVKIKNGDGTGSLWIGGDVNAGTSTANTRKLGRIVVPTYANPSLGATLLGFDSNGDDSATVPNRLTDAVSFGGMKKITNATSPMCIIFCVASTRSGTAANQKVYPLEMDATVAKFNVQPKYGSYNLVTTNDLNSVDVSTFTNDAGYLTLSTLPKYDGSVE